MPVVSIFTLGYKKDIHFEYLTR